MSISTLQWQAMLPRNLNIAKSLMTFSWKEGGFPGIFSTVCKMLTLHERNFPLILTGYYISGGNSKCSVFMFLIIVTSFNIYWLCVYVCACMYLCVWLLVCILSLCDFLFSFSFSFFNFLPFFLLDSVNYFHIVFG